MFHKGSTAPHTLWKCIEQKEQQQYMENADSLTCYEVCPCFRINAIWLPYTLLIKFPVVDEAQLRQRQRWQIFQCSKSFSNENSYMFVYKILSFSFFVCLYIAGILVLHKCGLSAEEEEDRGLYIYLKLWNLVRD